MSSQNKPSLRSSIESIKRRVYLVAFPLIGVALAVFTTMAWRSGSTGDIAAWGFPVGLALIVVATSAVWLRWVPLRWLEYALLATAIGGLLVLMVYTGFGVEHSDPETIAFVWWSGYWLPVVYAFLFMVFGVRIGTLLSVAVYTVALATGFPHFMDPEDHAEHHLRMLAHGYLSNIVIIVLLTGVATILQRQSRHSDRLEGEVHTDVLTWLPNRRLLSRLIVEEMARAERYERPFSIVLFDLDHFKVINDRYGHPVGDAVLMQIGPILAEHVRETDTIGRWGGEEFLVVLPEMGVRDASRMAERLRTVIERGAFPADIDLTASFGVTHYVKGESMASLLERVDRELYSAKDAGRNRVSPSPPEQATGGGDDVSSTV
jgi:diguanylate cyclase (GGDEF)-like protein